MKTSELGKWQDIADETQCDVLYWKKIARQAQAERDELAAALKAILDGPAKLVKPGDWPVWDIARAALARMEAK